MYGQIAFVSRTVHFRCFVQHLTAKNLLGIYALVQVRNASTPYRCYLCITNFTLFREVLNIERTRNGVLNYVKL